MVMMRVCLTLRFASFLFSNLAIAGLMVEADMRIHTHKLTSLASLFHISFRAVEISTRLVSIAYIWLIIVKFPAWLGILVTALCLELLFHVGSHHYITKDNIFRSFQVSMVEMLITKVSIFCAFC